MDNHSFDVLVIGAGQAAMPLIFDLAKAGKRVALAERKHLGGSCVNFGCTPTKAAIASARVAHLARRGAEFGIRIPTVEIDFPAVLAGARAVAEESRQGLEDDLADVENPLLLRGHARLDGREGDAFRVRIDARTITARQVVLDTGTRTRIPSVPGLDGIDCLHAGNWLDRPELPEHLILLGGGYIGLEMGQFYRRMGSRVTILDRAPRLLEREEEEVSTELLKLLTAEGIAFRPKADVTRVAKAGAGVVATVESEGKTSTIEGSHLFVAVGRMPNTDDLGLETVGVTVGRDGSLPVDVRLSTNVAGIWVAGDIRGGPLFTHTSWDDYRILKSQLLGDGSRTTERIVPYAVFTDPQLGRVGLTESEARRAGKTVKTGRFDMYHNGRAREYREKNGFIKVVVDAETDRLLGATVLSDEAGELVHIYVDLMNADAPVRNIRDVIYVHPTYAEAVQSATEAAG